MLLLRHFVFLLLRFRQLAADASFDYGASLPRFSAAAVACFSLLMLPRRHYDDDDFFFRFLRFR